MHLPDGFLSPPVATAAWVASAGSVGVALRQVSRDAEGQSAARTTLTAGVLAAFVFVAQMFNFPVAGGTTGHLLGAALCTALLGPWLAILVLTVVLLIQALVFADGGVVVYGANLFNMGVGGCLLSALILPAIRRLRPSSPGLERVSLAVAAWASVMLAALLTAVELAASGTVPARVVIPAMLGVHAVIGVGEALLSIAAYALLASRRPDVAEDAPQGSLEGWRVAAVLALGLVTVRLAFPAPDGLESVAQQQGFESAATEPAYQAAPLPDYTVPSRPAPAGFDWFGSYLSAGVGMVLCGGLMFAIGALPRRRRPA